MRLTHRFVAAAEVLFVLPATLFMTALFVRNLQPVRYEPAHTAQEIVDWYAQSTHVGLWLLLVAFPLATLVVGTIALGKRWRADVMLRQSTVAAIEIVRDNLATLLIAGATCASAIILAIVALHVATD